MGHGCPNTRHEKIMALGRVETAERGRRDRGSDVIAKVFRYCRSVPAGLLVRDSYRGYESSTCFTDRVRLCPIWWSQVCGLKTIVTISTCTYSLLVENNRNHIYV